MWCDVWCGVVWCGVMWCDVVWCYVMWCDVMWCGVMWCGVMWCGVMWCDVVWCDVMWCGVMWCVVMWCGVMWFRSGGTLFLRMCSFHCISVSALSHEPWGVCHRHRGKFGRIAGPVCAMSCFMAQQLCSKQHCATHNTRHHYDQCRVEVSNAHTHESSTVRVTFGSLDKPPFVFPVLQTRLFQPPSPETKNAYLACVMPCCIHRCETMLRLYWYSVHCVRDLWSNVLVFGFTVSTAQTDMTEQLRTVYRTTLHLPHLSSSTDVKCKQQIIIWITVD